MPSVGSTTTAAPSAKTTTQTSVASSATSVQLLAANAGRRGVTIFNDSTQALYVTFAATATTSNYTYKVFPSQTLEFPLPMYPGRVDGIWDAANGNVRITEFT